MSWPGLKKILVHGWLDFSIVFFGARILRIFCQILQNLHVRCGHRPGRSSGQRLMSVIKAAQGVGRWETPCPSQFTTKKSKRLLSYCNIATCFFMIAEFGNDARLPNRKFLAWKGCLCKKHGHNISLNTLFSWLCISSPCTHSLTNQLSKAYESQKIKNTNLYKCNVISANLRKPVHLGRFRIGESPSACSLSTWPALQVASILGPKFALQEVQQGAPKWW